MGREVTKPKRMPKMHFRPEGYASSGAEDFLEGLLAELREKGYEPDDLVFSGFDGTAVARGEAVPRYPCIFVMNEAGWRQAVKYREQNPADYAEGWETPCLGLYYRHQLVHVYSAGLAEAGFDIDDDTLHGRVELGDIELGDALDVLAPSTPVEEAVVHRDYPDGSPTDALVGVVFIDQDN